MSRTFALLCLATAVAGCAHDQGYDNAARGVSSVNVPVVTRADYSVDLAAPDGSLGGSEAARLDGWFRGMELSYGDVIYVDGPYSSAAREDVARIAGNYGLLVANGAPVTGGLVAPGTVRVIVSRNRAIVPNCPNWDVVSNPNLSQASMSNYGCGVNSNLAAMVANPEDLVHGREGSGVGDNRTAVKALDSYRKAEPTGKAGLKDISTKGKN